MEFFETVKQVASDVATVSAKQSKKLYIIAKLKLEIAEKQNIVKKLQKQIGIDAYEAYLTDSDIVATIEGKLKKIQLLEEKIDVLKKKVEQVKTEEDEIQLDALDFDEYDDYDYDDDEYEEEDSEEDSYDEDESEDNEESE